MDQIQIGDTVEVIAGCPCGSLDGLIGMYSIVEVMTERIRVITDCGQTDMFTRLALIELVGVKEFYPVRWLRKVPPLSELEKQKTQEGTCIPIEIDSFVTVK